MLTVAVTMSPICRLALSVVIFIWFVSSAIFNVFVAACISISFSAVVALVSTNDTVVSFI